MKVLKVWEAKPMFLSDTGPTGGVYQIGDYVGGGVLRVRVKRDSSGQHPGHHINFDEVVLVGKGPRGVNLYAYKGKLYRRLTRREIYARDTRPNSMAWCIYKKDSIDWLLIPSMGLERTWKQFPNRPNISVFGRES